MKTWLITGASSGFGREMTEQLLARGDRVAATTRKVAELDALKARYGDSLHVFHLDVTDSANVTHVVERAFAEMGSIDVVVSNAGYVLLGAAEEVEEAQIRHQLDTNLLGPILLMRAVLPYLRQQKQGRILQMSSEAGQMSLPAISIYQASKWGIEGFCESLRQEVAHFNIQVVLIEPGRAATSFDDNAVTQHRIMADYQKTTVGNYRRLLAMGRFPAIGDPVAMVRAMIQAADSPTPPRRLVLGRDSYKNIQKALSERLREVESQKDSAALPEL